jgi:hypothetical protein
MPMTMQHEGGPVYRLVLRGTLHQADLERCQDLLAGEIKRIGPVRLLFVLEDFDGWAPGDDWRDLRFLVEHGDDIEKIAIVGDERWRGHTLMFAGADLRKAPVEFFPTASLAQACAWLASAGRQSSARSGEESVP